MLLLQQTEQIEERDKDMLDRDLLCSEITMKSVVAC